MSDAETESRPQRSAPPARSPEGRLWLVFPRELARLVAVGREPVTLGRSEQCTVTLPQASVSRTHVSIAWSDADGAHVVTDGGSRHGTSVDGARISGPTPLRDNAVVRLADVVLVYEQGVDDGPPPTEALPGRSREMARVRAQVARAAADTAPVLITGPTGAGKDLAASEVHRLSGRAGPLVPVNCAAISPQLADSQLFGHAKGAFTGADAARQGLFAAAEGGTLFLDEVGELSPDMQAKLLRVLQQREVLPVGATRPVRVDVRVVAATNRVLETAVEAGAFRRDLWARLALWEVRLPALTARRADIVDWLERLASRRAGRSVVPAFEAEAIEAILCAPLTENLRTLDRLVHALDVTGEVLGVHALPPWLTAHANAPKPDAPAAVAPPTARPEVPTPEALLAVLREKGSVRAAAKHFGRDRKQIYRWIKAWKLDVSGLAEDES